MLFYPNNIYSLLIIFKKIISLHIPYFIIGNGSNLLINDCYFDGIVISLKKINQYKLLTNNILMIEAGSNAITTINKLSKMKIGNLETFGTIPGTIGGLIYNNAGTQAKEIKDVIIAIDYLDIDGKIKTYSKDELGFRYRYSSLKEKSGIILRGYFLINHQGNINLLKTEWQNKIKNQPLDTNNFGSTFKNLPNIKAWQIIKKLNVDEIHFNDAKISKKHQNFLINEKNATFQDMLNLINYLKVLAKEKLNYDLELEIEIIENFKNINDKGLRIN